MPSPISTKWATVPKTENQTPFGTQYVQIYIVLVGLRRSDGRILSRMAQKLNRSHTDSTPVYIIYELRALQLGIMDYCFVVSIYNNEVNTTIFVELFFFPPRINIVVKAGISYRTKYVFGLFSIH